MPEGPHKYAKSLSLFQPLMPVEHACELGGEQGRPMGDITRSSDAIATPAIAATDMIMVVSVLNIIAEI